MLSLAVGMVMSIPARATLVNRGGGLLYDNVLHITWLQNANQGAGSSFDNGTSTRPSTTDGFMSWQNAVDWAAGLSFGGSDDRRLPTTSSTSPTASAFDCTTGAAIGCAASGNELGDMYFHLGRGREFASNEEGEGNP